jgi:hypothetical protein
VFIPTSPRRALPLANSCVRRIPASCCSAATVGTILRRWAGRRRYRRRGVRRRILASSQRRATQDFVAAYRAAYNATPEILEAQAFDAASWCSPRCRAVRAAARRITALQSPRSFEGAAGTVAVSTQGIQRQLFLLRVASGTISEIVPSARSLPAPAPPPLPMAGQAAVP